MDFNIGKTGMMSAIPYLAMAIMIQLAGHWADVLRTKRILTTTQVRRIFTCVAFIAQTIFMIGTTLWLTRFGAMFCLTMAVAVGAFSWAGFM